MRIIELTQSSCVNVRSCAETELGEGSGFSRRLKKRRGDGGCGGLYSLA